MELEQQIISLLQKEIPIRKISKQLSCDRKIITRIAKDHEFDVSKKRKYQIKENYFSNINSEIKAYLLGIVFSGGTICSSRNMISFNFASKDKETLELFSQEIYSKNVVKNIFAREYKDGCSKFCIYNRQIKNDLIALGGGLKKECKFPNLKENLLAHFLRGIFERDGCLYVNQNDINYNITISVNENNKNYFSNILTNLNIKFIFSDYLKIYGKQNCLKFLDYIYNDCNFKLTRKFEKYQSVKNEIRLNKTQIKLILFDIEVVHYYNSGLSARQIAKKLNTTKASVLRSYKRVGFLGKKRIFRKAHLTLEKKCVVCETLKPISNFKKRIEKKYQYISYEMVCSLCRPEYTKVKNKIRYEKSIQWHKDYSVKNKHILSIKNKIYREKNKDKLRNKYLSRTNVRKHWLRIYTKKKRINDLTFRLRDLISNSINYGLKRNNSSKNNNSCLQFLPYTMQELKEHLEKQFEPWMNWKNQGRYVIEQWNDDDSSTWKWQIDHIIPHSLFNYTSMDSEEFKKCWALENLRPLSAKENMLKSNKLL